MHAIGYHRKSTEIYGDLWNLDRFSAPTAPLMSFPDEHSGGGLPSRLAWTGPATAAQQQNGAQAGGGDTSPRRTGGPTPLTSAAGPDARA